MAEPVPFHAAPRNAHAQLRARLETAPEEHAAALLAACDILQELHDRGILDLVKSGLASSDELLEMLVDGVNTPETIRAIRNLLFWRGVLGQIEPEGFQGIFQAIPDALTVATARRDQPLSLWKILRRAVSKDSLRGLTAAVDLLESFGRHLNVLEHAAQKREPANGAG
jgi:uncharacterized protein YjgD (DUF1641 family)